VQHFCHHLQVFYNYFFDAVINTVEFHLSGVLLSGSPVIHICLTLRVNLSRILQN